MARLAEFMVLAGATWPLARLCATRPFWHTFPRLAATAAGLLAAYVLLVASFALLFPYLILPLVVLAGGASLAIAWWAHPRRGCRRGWPPGSLTLLTPTPWFDERFFLDQASRHGPVFKTSYFLRPMVCIVGLDAGLELLQRYDKSLGTPPLPFSRFIPGGYLRYMDPDAHQDYKTIFRDAFSPQVVQDCAHFMRDDIRQSLRLMAVESAQTPTMGVRPKPYLNRMLFATWVRLFLGIGSEAVTFAQLYAHFHTIDMRNPSGASDRAIEQALEEISAIVRQQLHQFASRKERNQAIPRCFLAELDHSHPRAVHDPTVLRNLIYFLHVTWSDVAALLLWLLKMLSDHSEWVTRLRDTAPGLDYDVVATDDLGARIVMETLRLEQSEHLYRRALQDIHFKGFVIPKGWMVRICVRESHQNEGVFTRPESFDPDRFIDRSYKLSEYCPFGAYRLACLGQHLTKIVGRIFVNEIATEYEWRVTCDGPREFGSWRHWTPNSKFRVHIARRSRDGNVRHTGS